MSVSVREFKQHCRDIIRHVERTGRPVKITHHGKMVARLRPRSPAAGARAHQACEELRACGSRLLAEPGESILCDDDFEALRRALCSTPSSAQGGCLRSLRSRSANASMEADDAQIRRSRHAKSGNP